MALRSQGNLTISFGLVNVGVSMQTLIEAKDLTASGYCATHPGSKRQMRYVCSHPDGKAHALDDDNTIMGYEYEGNIVGFDPTELRMLEQASDKRIALTQYVYDLDIDPLYYQGSYMLWAQKGHEQGFDLMLHLLKADTEAGTPRALVGTFVQGKTTKMLVVRYSERTGTLLAHTCTYAARVRDGHLADIRKEQDTRPAPTEEQLTLARTLLGTLTEAFDPAAVTDVYTERVREAIAQKAKTGTLTPIAGKADSSTGPVPDVIAALKASIDKAAPKKKAPAKKAASNGKAKVKA